MGDAYREQQRRRTVGERPVRNTRGMAITLVATAAAWTLFLTAGRPAMAQTAPIPVGVVQAPDAPIKLEQVKLLNTDASPMVLLYGATNTGSTDLDQFTVTVFVFDANRQLKARQVAPGRRTLTAGETKFSAMVLDVGGIAAGDRLLAGVDQAQQVGSDDWWRADLRTIAEAQMKSVVPK